MNTKTRVVKHGAFWRIEVLRLGVWQTMRDLYCTRHEARSMRFWWA